MRYVQCYRCEAIQCREDNIRLTYLRCLRQPWIASPHFINYVSQVRWRLRKDGQGDALPSAHGAGETTPPLRGHPSTEGIGFGRGDEAWKALRGSQ
ncbi:MAG: hypothetical protein LBM98_00765 [Oscillospiraceae bacterium]|nr:hypothetical protein [Oscillospiraceae bacterium]